MENYALITGATSGIGLSIANIHASKGDNLVITGQNSQKLSMLKREFETKYKIEVQAFSVDLTKPGNAEKLYQRIVSKDINIKYLINNAGFGLYGFFKDTTLKREVEMIELNILALTKLTKLVIPQMIIKGEGYILNVASVAAFIPGPLMSVYYATKNYVLAFSEALSNELKGTGVSVTTLCPGPTKTNFTNTAKANSSKVLTTNLMPAKKVALIGYNAMLKRKRIIIPGLKNKFLAFIPRFFPRRWVTNIVRKVNEKSNKK